jgi:hypothetical protein
MLFRRHHGSLKYTTQCSGIKESRWATPASVQSQRRVFFLPQATRGDLVSLRPRQMTVAPRRLTSFAIVGTIHKKQRQPQRKAKDIKFSPKDAVFVLRFAARLPLALARRSSPIFSLKQTSR